MENVFLGILNSFIELALDVICCRLKLGKYKPKEAASGPMQTNSLTSSTIPESNSIPSIPVPTLATTPTADSSQQNAQHLPYQNTGKNNGIAMNITTS